MGLGTNADPIQPLTSVLPGLNERPGGVPIMGVQKIISVKLVDKTAASTTYKTHIFTAPSDGWWIKEIYVSAVVVPSYASQTLALDNYDKSATAARNALSAATYALGGLTLKQGAQMALTATDADRFMDEGDVLNATVAIGASESTAGEGLGITVVMVGPEID